MTTYDPTEADAYTLALAEQDAERDAEQDGRDCFCDCGCTATAPVDFCADCYRVCVAEAHEELDAMAEFFGWEDQPEPSDDDVRRAAFDAWLMAGWEV